MIAGVDVYTKSHVVTIIGFEDSTFPLSTWEYQLGLKDRTKLTARYSLTYSPIESEASHLKAILCYENVAYQLCATKYVYSMVSNCHCPLTTNGQLH